MSLGSRTDRQICGGLALANNVDYAGGDAPVTFLSGTSQRPW
jgi:hypothetical protein